MKRGALALGLLVIFFWAQLPSMIGLRIGAVTSLVEAAICLAAIYFLRRAILRRLEVLAGEE
jgi:hypothetical protein